MTEFLDVGGRFCWPFSPETLVACVYSFFRRNGTTTMSAGDGWSDLCQLPLSAGSRLIQSGLVSLRALATEVESAVISCPGWRILFDCPGWTILFLYVVVLVVLGTIRELYGYPNKVRSRCRFTRPTDTEICVGARA